MAKRDLRETPESLQGCRIALLAALKPLVGPRSHASIWEPQMAILGLNRTEKHVVIYMPYDAAGLKILLKMWTEPLDAACQQIGLDSWELHGIGWQPMSKAEYRKEAHEAERNMGEHDGH